MATYTIKILNQSLADKSYGIFMEPPQVSTSEGQPEVYTNAWISFPNLTNGSWDAATYTDNTYAYWLGRDQAAPDVAAASGGFMAVNTASCDTVVFTNTGATGFKDLISPGHAKSGSFSIVAGTDFTPLNGFIFGLAHPSGAPMPAPVSSFKALPNETYTVTPVVKFYVADGAYTPGQVVDVSDISTSGAVIDFTGRPQTTATVVQEANGAFSVTYS